MGKRALVRLDSAYSLRSGSKRMKQTVENSNDPLMNLLPEILVDIFLRLRNEDLFLSCSLVSKGWRDFIRGNLLWEGLIIREFGPERARSFLRVDGALNRFKKDLATHPAFRFDYFRDHLENARTFYPTFEQFIPTLVSERRQKATADDHFKYSKISRYFWLKVPPRVFEAMDLLKIPLAFGFTEDSSPKTISLVASNLDMLSTTQIINGKGVAFFRDYPSGGRYFVCLGGSFSSFRLVLPGFCDILTRTRELRDAVFKPSPEDVKRILKLDPRLGDYSRVDPKRLLATPFGLGLLLARKKSVLKPFFDQSPTLPPSALVLAVQHDAFQAVKLFFDHGADANMKGEDGQPLLAKALYLSGTYCSKQLVNFLIDKGADVNFSDQDGTTLLMRCAEKAGIDAIRCLVQRGANVHALNKNKQSVLQFALSCPDKFPLALRLNILLSAGAKVNVRFVMNDGSKSNALIEAVRRLNAEAVKILLEHGANVRSKDSSGWTALDYAKDYQDEEIKNLLSKARGT